MSISKNRQLAAILFADIVGYTALMQKEEADALTILNRFQTVIQDTAEEYDGEVIKTYGDGTLLLFSSSVNAVECAQDIQIAFQDSPKVPLRIGIHVGEFVRKGNDIFGNGINIAARIESIGVAGSVLFSQDVAKRIKNHPEFETYSLGSFNFKHVEETIEVFALTNDNFAIPSRTDLKGKASRPVILNHKWLIPTIVSILVVALTTFAIWNYRANTSTLSPKKITKPISIPANIAGNSLAVLPFANMSINKENDYFSEGMHDDLLTHLSKIGDMKVISRTSVLQFKDTQKPIPEIANMLGVTNILEGSVRRSGNQVRVNVQLINAIKDEHIWSEIYDKELTAHNIFDIQTEIATTIAAALRTNISSTQKVALTTRPTENLEAYEAYLRGRYLVEERIGKSIIEAKKYLEKAIELDPNFAQAYVKLGEANYLLVEYASEDAAINFPIAWTYCQKAKAINPNLAEVYALECTLNHYDKGDIENARKAYEKAIALNPNYADVYFWYSHAVIEIEKDFEKSLSILEKAVRLNPLSPKFVNRLGHTYESNGLMTKAVQTFDKGIKLAPKHIFLPRNLSFLYTNTNKLDSAAMTMHRALKRNPNVPKWLEAYMDALIHLDMTPELTTEIKLLNKSNRKEQLLYLTIQSKYAVIKGQFEEAEQYFQQLASLKKETEGLDLSLAFNVYYYQKDFQKVINTFEQYYSDLLTIDFFGNTMVSGYNRKIVLQEQLQKYIYSLTQTGAQEKAQQLLVKYGDQIIQSVNPKGDLNWENQKRVLFKVKNYLIKGQEDLAMIVFSRYGETPALRDRHMLLIDPIFDAFKNDPSYLNVINSMQTEVMKQRTAFRSYLTHGNKKNSNNPSTFAL